MPHLLASYNEKRFDGRRRFELFSDHLIVRGSQSFGAEFETTIAIASLAPVVNTFRVRPRGFGGGIALALGSISLLQSGFLTWQSYWGGLALVIGISGVLLSLATARKVFWAQFNFVAGAAAVTIAKSGPEKEDFDKFVGAISGSIVAATSSSSPGGA